jgi:hypothetical protein
MGVGVMIFGSLPGSTLRISSVESRSWHFSNRLLLESVVQKPERIENEVEMIFSRQDVAPSRDEIPSVAASPDKSKNVEVRSVNKKPVKTSKDRQVAKEAKIVVASKEMGKTQPLPVGRVDEIIKVESLLDEIRSDPKRVFIDEELIVGDLTWTAKNLAPGKGVEIWVESSRNSINTYYVPYAQLGTAKASFDCKVLSPGSKGVAALPIGFIKGKSLTIEVGATGSISKNWRIRVP